MLLLPSHTCRQIDNTASEKQRELNATQQQQAPGCCLWSESTRSWAWPMLVFFVLYVGSAEERWRLGRGAPPPRRQECLQSKLRDLMEGSLLQRTQEVLEACGAPPARTPVSAMHPSFPPKPQSPAGPHTNPNSTWEPQCSCSHRLGGSYTGSAALEALRQAVEAAMEGVFGAPQLHDREALI